MNIAIAFFAGMTYMVVGVLVLTWADKRWRGTVSDLVARSRLAAMSSIIAWPVLLFVASRIWRRQLFPRSQASVMSAVERSRRRMARDSRFGSAI